MSGKLLKTGCLPSELRLQQNVDAILDAVTSDIGNRQDTQTAIADAIADEIVASQAFQDALDAASPNLVNCAGQPIAKGASIPTCTEMNDAIGQAVSAGATPDATDAVKGKVALASVAETAAATDASQAITPAGLAGALNDSATAGGNAMQKAVVNALEQALASDTGAQKALADAIADDLQNSPGFAASVKAAETTTTLIQSGTGYVYTNEDGSQTSIQAGTFLSTAAGQSLSTKPDGGLYVNVIGMLPSDSTYSGSTLGNVDISIVGDGANPENFTIQGDLNVAAKTPTNDTNLLSWSPSGFYVSASEIVAAIAANPAALQALMDALTTTPDVFTA